MLFNLRGDVFATNGATMAGKGEKVTHVRLNAGVLIVGDNGPEHHDAGEVVTVPVELGADLIGSKRGEEIEEKDLATAKADAARDAKARADAEKKTGKGGKKDED